jgi:hypothetical protein
VNEAGGNDLSQKPHAVGSVKYSSEMIERNVTDQSQQNPYTPGGSRRVYQLHSPLLMMNFGFSLYGN